MNPSYYIPILLLLFIVIWMSRQNKMFIAKKFIKNRLRKDKCDMVELAKRFIDKECLIYTFNSNQIEGTIKDVTDGAILLDSKGTIEAVNLDFVVRIREFPKTKTERKSLSC